MSGDRSTLTARIVAGLAWSDQRLLDLRDSMTAGQRQTAVLALALAALVVVAGAPAKVVTRPAARSDAGSASRTVPAGRPAALPAAGTGGAGSVPTAAGPAAIVTLAAGPGTAAGPPGGTAAPPARRASRLVALVQPAGTSVPGHDDSTIAGAFLKRAGLIAATVVADPSDPALCAKVATAGDLVLAGIAVDPDLRTCLVAAGEVLVEPDLVGDLPPGSPSGGQVVATERGIGPSLVDTASWLTGQRSPGGPFGIVTVAAHRRSVEDAIPVMQRLGLAVADVAYLPDGQPPDPSAVRASVLDFSGRGVRTVLFAAPVADQVQWAVQAAALATDVHYLVVDADDAIVDESYPPTFAGAQAYTARRGGWFARAHGPTAAQAACDATWDAAATPPRALGTAEQEAVYAWCEAVGMVAAAAPGGGPAPAVAAILRAATVASPLTSDLGPLGAGRFGPTQDAVVVWQSTCGCWQETALFRTRTVRAS